MKFCIVAGTRPNFVKISSLLTAFSQVNGGDLYEVVVVHTGQHYDDRLSGSFFRELRMRNPDFNLNAGSGSHAEQTARVMTAFEPLCVAQRPDWVIVVGDVNSTLAAALVAKKLGIRVAHVEAGLRSGDNLMPEEINRRCTDAIADIFFTTEPSANMNLCREGVSCDRIHFVGNTMIDALCKYLDESLRSPLPIGLVEKQFAIVTLHRPSNVDFSDRVSSIVDSINRVAEDIPILFPIHPRTAARVNPSSLHPAIHVMDPMSYLQFIGAIARARFVLTDSGGIQEETTALGVPCLTMRCNTERPITCDLGTNTLVGTDPHRIVDAVQSVLSGSYRKGRMPEKWDGRAANRIVYLLTHIDA